MGVLGRGAEPPARVRHGEPSDLNRLWRISPPPPVRPSSNLGFNLALVGQGLELRSTSGLGAGPFSRWQEKMSGRSDDG